MLGASAVERSEAGGQTDGRPPSRVGDGAGSTAKVLVVVRWWLGNCCSTCSEAARHVINSEGGLNSA